MKSSKSYAICYNFGFCGKGMKGLETLFYLFIFFWDSLYFVFFQGTGDEYEIGDLSGKYGSFLNLTSYDKTHTDYNLPLFGRNSIQGRSIVIHNLKVQDNNRRWVCNNLMPVVDPATYFMKATANFTGPTLTGIILIVSWNIRWEAGSTSTQGFSRLSKWWRVEGHCKQQVMCLQKYREILLIQNGGSDLLFPRVFSCDHFNTEKGWGRGRGWPVLNLVNFKGDDSGSCG